MKRGVLWTFVSGMLLLSVSALVYWDYTVYVDTPVDSEENRQVKVVIAQSSTLTQVAEMLREKELIYSPTYFRFYLLLNGIADSLKAGAYYFETSQTPAEMASMLAKGPKTPFLVLTIKEGFNIWQIASAFEEAGLGDADDVLELLKDPALADKAGVLRGTGADHVISRLEGWVFPETYYVEPGQSLENIILRMVKQTFKELKAAKKKHLVQYSTMLEEVGLSDYEIMVMASIVERETALPHEKKLVASVVLNRIKKQMPLQVDPALTYSNERKGARPTVEDRKNESNPYNTYVFQGFPPGPICNPGRESIAASVAPASSGFLFFVAKRDGTGGHHFTTNYEDHKRAVRKYLKKEN